MIAVNQVSKCKVDGCNEVLKGSHSSNLERHLERKHFSDFKKLQKIKEKRPSTSSKSKKNYSRNCNNYKS